MNDVIVGEPVHYYTQNVQEQSNGVGMGPYYGIVTQAFPGSPYANLKVFPPFAAPYDAGSVQNREGAFAEMTGAELPARWYEPMQVVEQKFFSIDADDLKRALEAAGPFEFHNGVRDSDED